MHTKRLIGVLALGLALALVWLVGEERAAEVHAASFTVTKFTDSNDGACNTDCSLREAIIAANGNGEADTITLQAGTYVLTITGASENAAATGDLDVTAPLTLIGQGAGQTIINANGLDRAFDIRPGAGAVTISSVTVVNGYVATGYGGGIYCEGSDLTLASVVVSASVASGSYYGGGLYAYQSSALLSGTQIISNTAYYGGGVYNRESAMTVTHSAAIGNHAAWTGAGIFNDNGALTLTYSALLSNTALHSAGGVYQSGSAATLAMDNSLVANNYVGVEGGGVFITGGQWATIGSSTISSNRANTYGGGLNSRIPTTVTHSTIAGNVADDDGDGSGDGGGVFAYQGDAHLYFEHTIIADNVDRGGTNHDCQNWGGSITSQGYNLVETVGNCTFGAASDITGQDPLLGPLQDNGGATWTQALLAGSLAIDAGDPAFAPPPAYDQRGAGFPRVIVRIDIGAFEAWEQVFLPLVLRNY